MDKGIPYFTTEKGSKYLHLINGKTQRFKEIIGKLCNPMDLIVFLPEYKFIKERAPEKQLRKIGQSESEYFQTLFSYTHTHGRKIHAVNKYGKRIEKNSQLEDTNSQVYLEFGTKKGNDFYIPISKDPQIGTTPYDTKLEKNGNIWIRSKHLGHKVIGIGDQN